MLLLGSVVVCCSQAQSNAASADTTGNSILRDLSQEFESTMLAAVDQDGNNSW